MEDSSNTFLQEIEKYRLVHSNKAVVMSVKSSESFVNNDAFADGSLTTHLTLYYLLETIKQKKRAISVLDYGCGKAKHTYQGRTKINSTLRVPENFFSLMQGSIQCYYCYDPAVSKYNKKPSSGSLFDVVTMIDVAEHIPEEYIEDVIKEIFAYTKEDGLLVTSISGSPSFHHFSEDGVPTTNLHVNLKSKEWWIDILTKYSERKAFVLQYNFVPPGQELAVLRYFKQDSEFIKLPNNAPDPIRSLDSFQFLTDL